MRNVIVPCATGHNPELRNKCDTLDQYAMCVPCAQRFKAGLRFDAESVRVDACVRSVFISDEYGPFVYRFSLASGKRIGSIALPNTFLADKGYGISEIVAVSDHEFLVVERRVAAPAAKIKKAAYEPL